MNIFKGYLTYLMAGVAVLFGLYNLVVGEYISKEAALAMVWAGLTAFGIRRAI